MYSFKDKIAVVTGAGRGIGRVIAADLAAEGVKVCVPDLDIERARATAKLLGPSVMPAQLDVSNASAVGALFRQIGDEIGGVDFLVNCAGGYSPRVPTLEITEAEFDMVLDSNLKGTFLCCQAAIPQMIRKRSGAIVNFSSIAGRQTSPALGSHYTAAKAGVLGLTRHLAKEFGCAGIRINAIAPGTTEGDRIGDLLTPADRERQIAGIPLGRFATEQDLSRVVLFLLSDEARYITGATIDVNGGSLTI
ncbi:MAG TPA: SDR family NAD(P)-dependent oxidoreductase [Verrucomicrobiae bacterium]|nr:SDR family NAD(P)-dependent oxidoreductase [Verrucomicrobiae bacterium]